MPLLVCHRFVRRGRHYEIKYYFVRGVIHRASTGHFPIYLYRDPQLRSLRETSYSEIISVNEYYPFSYNNVCNLIVILNCNGVLHYVHLRSPARGNDSVHSAQLHVVRQLTLLYRVTYICVTFLYNLAS